MRYERAADRAARAAVQRETGVGRPRAFAPRTRVLKIRDGQSTADTLRELRARPEVATAAPNPIARVTGFIPDDPGRAGRPGRLAAAAVELPRRRPASTRPTPGSDLIDVGRPGGRGVTVAVLDTGVAYADRGRCRARRLARHLPPLARLPRRRLRARLRLRRRRPPPERRERPRHARRGHDRRGHRRQRRRHRPRLRRADHAGARARPDRRGRQRRDRGRHPLRRRARRRRDQPLVRVRHAGHARARSPTSSPRCATRAARACSSSAPRATRAARSIAYPARADDGALGRRDRPSTAASPTTPTPARASTSSPRAAGATRASRATRTASPTAAPAGSIYQMTFDGSLRRFGLPGGYTGTSMAAPHVAAAAALVIASGRDRPRPVARGDRGSG